MAASLWKKSVGYKVEKTQLYKNVLDEVLDIIHVQQRLFEQYMEKKTFLLFPVPNFTIQKAFEHFYKQEECAIYLCKELKNRGFFCKTVDRLTKIYISWSPIHLEIIAKVKEAEMKKFEMLKEQKRLQEIQIEKNKLVNMPYIDLDGRSNDRENKAKLTSFLISCSRNMSSQM